MITKETISKEQACKLLDLIDKWVHCEVASRMAPVGWPQYGQYAYEALQYRDEIWRHVFGTSCLAELAAKWNILPPIDQPRKRHLEELRRRLKKPIRYNRGEKGKRS